MREINISELKKIQLEILDVFADFCNRHQLKYWLDNGTLLGAIRHKGYIPWDDDIDTGMLREDFNKCIELFNNENERYQFVCVENNKDFCYPFAKIFDTKTLLYEPNKEGNRLSVNIDVFVYDNAPDDDQKLKLMFSWRDFWEKMDYLRLPYNIQNKGTKRLVGEIIRLVPRAFPKQYFSYKIYQNSRKYENIETKRIGNFTSLSKVVADKSVFETMIDIEFEGKSYMAPAEYDKWLRLFYGDYMKLPPIEKRVAHHQFEAYWID